MPLTGEGRAKRVKEEEAHPDGIVEQVKRERKRRIHCNSDQRTSWCIARQRGSHATSSCENLWHICFRSAIGRPMVSSFRPRPEHGGKAKQTVGLSVPEISSVVSLARCFSWLACIRSYHAGRRLSARTAKNSSGKTHILLSIISTSIGSIAGLPLYHDFLTFLPSNGW